MCGIFGYIGKQKKAAHIVVDGLKTLEYRGYDSWGIAYLPGDEKLSTEKPLIPSEKTNKYPKLKIDKNTGKITDEVKKLYPSSSFALGHTRWATHGGVTKANAHPHTDCTGAIALIHNGIIENYIELRKKLIKLGHKFKSETDTEVAVHLIEEYTKTMITSKAVQRAFSDIKGLNAFIVMNSKERRLIAVRNGSPLVVGYGNGENYIASDAIALVPHTKQVHFLEDNQMAIVGDNAIMVFNALTGDQRYPVKQHLTWSVDQTIKGKYPFFMLKEIYEQPAILADISANYENQAIKLASLINKSYGTYMVGCGTAAYACLAGSYLFSTIAKRHVNWAMASEFSYQLDFLKKKSLIIALSQSGETMDTLEAVRKAKIKGAKVISLVNAVGSSLFRESDHTLLIGEGPEKGVASTKAFTAKLAHLILLSYAMVGKVEKGEKILTQAVKATKKIITESYVKNIRELAKILKDRQHIYVIGRGLSYPASLECALKIKEISYIHSEGLAAGELKHGPLALVEKGTPCISYIPNDKTYDANLAGAMEMKARGGYIVGISNVPNDIFDYYLPVDDCQEATIIPNVIVGQVLAYELAVMKGFDPDKPRNLAKSVTVK
ncbi:glutamine--fructose-6-phosphate transaminase (isomerizing) [Patescibacteria group bacterium]